MSLRAIAKKELRDVLRERSLVTAFVIQLFLAGFSALLLAGLTALHSPESLDAQPDITVAYVGPGGLDGFMRGAGIDVEPMERAQALDAFDRAEIAAVVEEDYGDPDGLRNVTVLLADGELETTLFVTQLKEVLIDYEESLRQDRLERLELSYLPPRTDARPEQPYVFVYSTLIPLLVVTPVFLSGAIAGDALSQESRSRTLLILRSAPISTTKLVIGKLLVPALLVPLQVAAWLGLFWLNGFPTAEPGLVIVFATIMGVFLTGTGGIIAALVRDESTTQAAYAVFVLAIGTFALLLPRDPMNVIALFTTGVPDALAWKTSVYLTAAAIIGVALSIWVTGRRIRTDRM